MDKETEELLEKERQEFAAMTPQELAAFEAKMKRAEARVDAMVEGLNAHTAKIDTDEKNKVVLTAEEQQQIDKMQLTEYFKKEAEKLIAKMPDKDEK